MATRKKAAVKAKRKKTRVTKAARRRKTTTVRKTETIRKRATKKMPRQVSSKKAGPVAAKAAVEPTPLRPPKSSAAQPTPPEARIGVVTHYYTHLSVATIRLESGTVRVGDQIHIRGHTTDFSQKVESLEVDHAPVTEVEPNADFGLKVVQHAREHDVVFKVSSQHMVWSDLGAAAGEK
jgi:hypothetical protein